MSVFGGVYPGEEGSPGCGMLVWAKGHKSAQGSSCRQLGHMGQEPFIKPVFGQRGVQTVNAQEDDPSFGTIGHRKMDPQKNFPQY